jgi:MscS family membrane protein
MNSGTIGPIRFISQWKIPRSRLTIGRVAEGPRRHEYLFTSGTVGRVIEYYQDIKSLPYRSTGPDTSPGFYRWYMSAPKSPRIAKFVARLPEWTKERFLGLTAWKWPGLILALMLACILMVGRYWMQNKSVQRVRGKHVFRYCLTIVYPFIVMLVPLAFAHVVKELISIRGTPLYLLTFCANVTSLLAAQVVVFGASNRAAETIIALPQIRPSGLDAQLIRIVSKLLGLLIAVILFLVVGQYLGIHLTTLLASAGVGGFAIALAAQDTLKTLFGTLMLMTDKPFRVGERIVFKTYDGVVEDIGLRSTRIRLLTGHQVTIPNDELGRSDIENIGRRPHIRRIADLHIPLDTPGEKIEQAVAIIRTALQDHEGMTTEYPPRVYFNEFNEESFNIRMIYWYSPPNYWDFLAFSERLNIEIYRAFEAAEICFSLPLRITPTSHASKEKPLAVQVMNSG